MPGALLDEPDKKGNTPFCVALDNRHDDVVNLLLEKDSTLLNQVRVTQEQIGKATRSEKYVLRRRQQYLRELGLLESSETNRGFELPAQGNRTTD